MKKIVLLLVMVLMPALFFAQDVFEKYERDEKVTSFIAGRKTFAMMASTQFKGNNETMQKGKEIIGQIQRVQLYTTENETVAADMKTTVSRYAKSSGLEELMQINHSGKKVSIMVKQGANENTVTQVLAFVGNGKTTSKNNETIIVLITGNFNLDDFSDLLNSKTVTGDKKTDDDKLAEIKNAFELKISPNPASGVFYINTDQAVAVKMYDLSGRMVKEQTYTSAGIITSDLAPATYVVEITSEDRKQTQKIIIK